MISEKLNIIGCKQAANDMGTGTTIAQKLFIVLE
jgi:hypothetical protein